ncbi:uncharacterized protein AMSG_08306 [Thecamonas trahens ATCC 50062]|uniref:Uncharacterized protein n=1 Tax=Thecamonas trahens ATCC 50062 TaxID=461836 RepID=A0A0L0DJ52_THETB|nr:hypothetical protein AMSG_08306 [Thecamonas trahens ATCC 50062]KNC52337.1 hypothetical protein AMSG_08306 [Thecamonas trahens ATCC 50062]|eukprot:XP_013755387.1 hypothetical protein AMSG_08306 [Thecamonas trahens ATCC 50062]
MSSASAYSDYSPSSADAPIVLDDHKDDEVSSSRDDPNAGSVSDVSLASGDLISDNGPPHVALLPARMNSDGELVAVAPMARGSSARSLTLLQPMAGWLAFCGYAPGGGIVGTGWAFLVWAMVVTHAVVMFSLTVYPMRLTESTLSGLAILALAPVITLPTFNRYMRSGVLEDEVATCKYVHQYSGRAVRQLALGHTLAAMAVSLFLVVGWNVTLGLALDGQGFGGGKSDALYWVELVTSIFAIPAMVTPLAMLSLVCNLHRLQCLSFIGRLTDADMHIPSALRLHQAIRRSIKASSRLFTRWVFPAALICAVSLTYQIYGYLLSHSSSRQYNGIYHIIAVTLILVVILGATTSVTRAAHNVRHATAELYAVSFGSAADISRFMVYLNNTDLAFRIFAVPMYPAYNSLVIVGFSAVVGGVVRQATI